MDRLNIVVGVISSGWSGVRSWMDGNEDRFMPGLMIGNVQEGTIERLRTLIALDSLKVLGEITAQYRGIPADDERLDPLYALAHELDVPVHIHVLGLGGSEDFPVHLGNPLRLAPVLGKYPGLRVYLENSGWPFLEEVTSLMYQYPSVYGDISTILHLTPKSVARAYLAGLVANGLAKRIMFGSDQMSWPEVIGESLEVIQNADFLTLEQKADILYNNAARFFRFSDQQIEAHQSR